MNSKFFTLNWADIAGAVILAVVVAILGYVVSVTDIALLSGHQILNIVVLTAASSLLKSLFTTEAGKIAGVQVK